jgi:hypothetical protein
MTADGAAVKVLIASKNQMSAKLADLEPLVGTMELSWKHPGDPPAEKCVSTRM